MFRRALLPLWRPALASSVRIPIPQYPSWYVRNVSDKTSYKLPNSTKDSQRNQPEKPQEPDRQKEPAADQAESDVDADLQKQTSKTFDASADAETSSQSPLPDLTKGIPSTLAAEFDGHVKPGPTALNLTEDPNRNNGYADGGRDGDGSSKDGYVSSVDRKRDRMAKVMYTMLLFGLIGGTVYMGRDWDTEEERKFHSSAPSGFGIGLSYNRIKARLADLTSYYKDPTFEKLLPDEDPQYRPPYTLVLSLEDLLVHSEWSREHGWRVAKRPGVDYFIRYLSQYYEIVLFTSVPSMMADQVLRKLDPFRIIRWPLFREATRYQDGEYIKDLSYLNRDLSKVILIDTKEEHARLQSENAIIMEKWRGDAHDKKLVSMIPLLEYIAGMGVEDVRAVLKSFEGTDIPVEFARRERAMRDRFQKDLAEEQKKRPRSGFGSLASALGLKPARSTDGEQSPSEALAQGKMLWDQIHERGQKNYEMIEREIRENGPKWLEEMAAEEEKFKEEQYKQMKGSFFGFFGADANKGQ